MKVLSFYAIIGLCIMLMSCSSKSTTNQSGKDTTALNKEIVGNDVDKRGCKGSAGFTWSEARQECIRVWEKGVKMEWLENSKSTSAAFVVFSPDSSQVELFLPEKEVHALLQRRQSVSEPNKVVWSSDKASNGLKFYLNAQNLWIIEQDGKVQFRQI